MSVHGAIKFRLRQKTSLPQVPGLPVQPTVSVRLRTKTCLAHVAAARAALAAERGDEDVLVPLSTTVKRKHVHYTFVHTANPQNKQPSDFTRKQYYAHLEKCYAEAYPCNASRSGILMFGLVAQERHAEAPQHEYRDTHFHCAAFTQEQHYWNKVAKLSLRKYKVPINAVAHDSYTEMYEYLRVPSAKKPLCELDASAWSSPAHPRGDDLKKLLRAGRRAQSANAAHARRGAGDKRRRARAPSLFDVVSTKRVRTVVELQRLANDEAAEGNPALAEFCTRQGHKLQDLLDNAWQIIEAPQRALDAQRTLMDTLRQAASDLTCVCAGRWPDGARLILRNNDIPVRTFCASAIKALTLGAKRGANVACVGRGGCGKSTLIEPLEGIFRTAAKPEAGSSFALANILGAEILLWQDYQHDERTMRFTDLLSLFVGEAITVRRPGAVGQKHANMSPCFYSGRTPIQPQVSDPGAAAELKEMMDERFTIFSFDHPLPHSLRVPDWPKCGKCCAAFYLDEGAQDAANTPETHSSSSARAATPAAANAPETPSSSSARPETPAVPGVVRGLNRLVELQQAGFLTADEFQAAKQRLLTS